VSPEDLESVEETLAIISDPVLMAQIGDSGQLIADGELGATLAEVRAEHERRRCRGDRDAAGVERVLVGHDVGIASPQFSLPVEMKSPVGPS
jgi:hypothetical protein